jgi:GNAT superfamily N-acetyltransferase
MSVAPGAPTRHFGSALVEAVADWARARGLARLILDGGAPNAPAIALYTHLGFVWTGC